MTLRLRWFVVLSVVLVAVGLRLAPATAADAPAVTVDASKVGQPINKFIYGQFIEHLGRCIYGGIWAEMLEDRKFFFPVGDKNSPWKATGPAGSVAMVREGAFVGVHSPRVTLADQPRGIVQAGLGLIEGKQYVGYVWLSGKDAGPVQVALVWGDGAADRQTVAIEKPAADYAKTEVKFTAGKTTDAGRLEITATGKGTLTIGTASVMPADNVQGMRPDTLALLKELDSPIYRWPGGNFVSGYNWRDGIGPRDRRPPRKNPAWTGVEHNDFGMDEFMVFCRTLGTEPYIAVNSGLGNVADAAAEVEYANGKADTPMGKLRAQNGHAESYGVKYWGVGNEMYGGWQLGHMPLEKYVEKHNVFAKAMRAVDPSIKLVAVGAVGRWSETMLRHCADQMDYMSEHFYVQQKPKLPEHVALVPDNIRRITAAHRGYREQIDALKGKDIRIAMDEWNYWYGPQVFGELGTRYFQKDGLGIAAGLHEFARHSDMYVMANYAQTVNVIGAIKTNKTAAQFESTGLVLKLYRRHFGELPVATEASKPLSAMAAFTPDRKRLTLGLVHPDTKPIEIGVDLKGVVPTGVGIRREIACNDPQAYNDPGKPPCLSIVESKVEGFSGKLKLAPCSVTLVELELK